MYHYWRKSSADGWGFEGHLRVCKYLLSRFWFHVAFCRPHLRHQRTNEGVWGGIPTIRELWDGKVMASYRGSFFPTVHGVKILQNKARQWNVKLNQNEWLSLIVRFEPILDPHSWASSCNFCGFPACLRLVLHHSVSLGESNGISFV